MCTYSIVIYLISNFTINRKGEATFKSDNVSTISVLKEFLSKEATKKKIKIEINTSINFLLSGGGLIFFILDINDDSINHVIKLLEPKLSQQRSLTEKITLLNALSELEVTEEETVNYLSAKYKDLLNNEKEIRASHDQSGYLERFYGKFL